MEHDLTATAFVVQDGSSIGGALRAGAHDPMLTDEISTSKVYSLNAETAKTFEPLWSEILKASVLPTGFDLERYRAHIDQPHLCALSDAINGPPSAEVMRLEKDVELLKLVNRSYPSSDVPYFSASSGVVNLKYLMTSLDDWSHFAQIASDLFRAKVKARGHFLYPPSGFRNWHTNLQSEEGWIMYVVRVEEAHRSFFRYVDRETNRLETLWDVNGAINFFHISRTDLFWHCIKSLDTYRWSRGFLVPDDWAQRLRAII